MTKTYLRKSRLQSHLSKVKSASKTSRFAIALFFSFFLASSTLSAQDLAITAVTPTPECSSGPSGARDVNVTYANPGGTSIIGATIDVQVDGGTVVSHTLTSNAVGTVAISVNHNGTNSHTYTVTANLTGDVNAANDVISSSFNDYPNATTGFSAVSGCEDEALGFVNSTALGTGTFTSSWAFGDGGVSNLTDPTHVFTTPGTYSTTLTTTTNNGCISSRTKNTIVHAVPVVNFTKANICDGVTASFNNITTISSGSFTSSWDFGDGASSTQMSPTHLYGGPATYPVTLTASTPQGCSDDRTKNIVIHPNPVAGFTTANQCLGTNVDFTNTSTIASGIISINSWEFGDGTTSGAASPSRNYGSPATYYVKLEVESPSGCTDDITMPVTVFAQPIASFTAADVCDGSATSFSNASTNAGGGSLSSSWDFGDGSATSNAGNPSHTYATPGTYTVTLTVTNSQGCTSMTTGTATVNPNPTADFSSTTVCLGNVTSFTDASGVASGTYSSFWRFGDGNQTTDRNPYHTYASSGTFNTILKITSNKGCETSVTKPVTVYDLPSPNFTVGNACVGQTATFTNSTTGFFTSLWKFGDGNTSTATSPTHTYALTGTYNVTLIITTPDGCNESYTKTITIHPTPATNFTKANVCDGVTANFANISSISSGSLTADWTFGDGSTSTVTSPNYKYATDGIYSVTLTSTSYKGCSSSKTKNIVIYPNPVASFTTSDVCSGTKVDYTNTSTISSGTIATNVWTFGDGLGSGMQSPSHNYTLPGTYVVKLTATSVVGCSDLTTQTVTVSPQPSASFTTSNACANAPSKFTNTSTTNAGLYSSTWTFGDGGTSTLGSPTHVYSSPGTYTVTLTVTNNQGCTDMTTETVTIHDNPVAAFSQTDVCVGKKMAFTDNSTLGSGAYTQNWQFGDGNSSTDRNPVHTYGLPNTYNVKLTVTSGKGCSDVASQDVEVFGLPSPAFTFSNVCDGTAATFTNNTTTPSGSNSYTTLWKFGDGVHATSQNSSHTYNNPGTWSPKLIVTSSQGCVAKLEKSITIFPTPVAKFITANECDGDAITLQNKSYVSDASGLTSGWAFGDGNTSTVTDPTHLYAAPGTYNITLTATSYQGCTNSVTNPVTIYPNPVASFTVDNQCYGVPVTPNNTSTGANQYFWDMGDGSTSNVMSPSRLYYQDGYYIIRLDVTSADGCKDNVKESVTVYPKPVVHTAKDTVVPKGLSVPLSAWSNMHGTYMWEPAIYLDDPTSQTPTATLDNDQTFTVIVTNNKGCTDTTTQTVTTFADYTVFPNNVMTPNSDGVNDLLNFGNLHNYPNNSLIIFDRWGREVHQKDLYTNDWDGTSNGDELPNGTYYYILTFDMNEDVVYKGSVTLLRPTN